MKEQVYQYIVNNPGRTAVAVNAALRDDRHDLDYRATCREIDALVAEGRVEARMFRGIPFLYAK